MKLNHTALLKKFIDFSLSSKFSKVEIFTKKISELNKLSNYMNTNFQIKRSSAVNYIPEKDSYRLRLILNEMNSQTTYKDILESYVHNNSIKNTEINTENFQEFQNQKLANTIIPKKSKLSLIDLNLKKNVFKKSNFSYSNNSNNFNDICGNYIKFVRNLKFFKIFSLKKIKVKLILSLLALRILEDLMKLRKWISII